jgi:amino acid transporter
MKTFVKVLVFLISAAVILVLFVILKMYLHSQGIYIATSWMIIPVISILYFVMFHLQKRKKEDNKNDDIQLNK